MSDSGARARFDDGKDAGALRTIGEVSEALGIKPHVLRYWEGQFPSLKPLKRAGGRRLYRTEDVATIERIDRMVNREGYTLKGAKAAIGGAPMVAATPAGGAARASGAAGDTIVRLKAIREDLAAAFAD